MRTLSKGEWIAVGLAVVIVGVFLGNQLISKLNAPLTNPVGQTQQNQSNQSQNQQQNTNTNPSTNTMPNANTTELMVKDDVVGTGPAVKAGDTVSVIYTGKFANGQVFDSNVGKAAIDFPIGKGYVIPGWDQGLIGMKVGGKRSLIIPPQLGYGANDYGPIPGNSTLYFDIELKAIK